MAEPQVPQMSAFIPPRLMKLGGIANWPNADVPLGGQVNEYIPALCKVPFDYLFRDDPVAMAECTLLVWEYIGIDLLVLNTDCYNFEAETMGAKLSFYEDHIPDVDRSDLFIKDESDLDKIKFTGFEGSRIPYLVEYCKAYKQYSGLDVVPSFSGPWSIAANLYGLENLIADAVVEPEFVHELMRRLVQDFEIPFHKALAEVIPGMQGTTLADAIASPPLVTKEIFEEFVVPYANDVLNSYEANGILKYNGVWGIAEYKGEERDDFVRQLIAAEGTLGVFDPDVMLVGTEYYRKIADEALAPLMFGFSTNVLQDGTPEEVAEAVKKYVLGGKAGITPFLMFLSNIAPATPAINIRTAVEATHVYGAPGATEDTPFEPLGEVESFEDFLRNKIANNEEGYTFAWLEKSEYSYLLG